MKKALKHLSTRRIVFVSALLVAVLLVLFIGNLFPASVEYITLGDYGYYPSLIATGEVIPPERIHLAAEVSGIVERIHLREGEIADSGAVIISLDPREYQIAYDRAKARESAAQIRLRQAQTQTVRQLEIALREAEAEFAKAAQEYNRQRNLFQQAAISKSAFEVAETAYKLAESRLEAARLEYESYQPGGVNIQVLESTVEESRIDRRAAQLNLERTKLRTPARVRVLQLNVERGELIQAGEAVAELGTLERIEIEVRIDQRFTQLGIVGTPAEVWISGNPDRKWLGKVVETKPRADAARGIRTSIVALDEMPEELVPGTIVSVQLISLEPEAAYLIPDGFLSTKKGQTGVWIAQNGRATFVPVLVGNRSQNGVLIRGDLEGGMHVLRPQGVSEGKRISINHLNEVSHEI